MSTSPQSPSPTADERQLRLHLDDGAASGRGAGGVHGAWWPWSRHLQSEAADLVDHFPATAGRINRILFSRPDWDDATDGGRGVRRIQAARGPVKVGSFPSDDTHLMILTMASGARLKLRVIPSDTDAVEGERLLLAAPDSEVGTDGDVGDRWDDESPGH